METVLSDGGLLSIIVAKISSNRDQSSAALVCKLWNEAVRWKTTKISVRRSSWLVQLSTRFPNVQVLDLSWCFDSLQDSDLALASGSFKFLRVLSLGLDLHEQKKIASRGLESIAAACGHLEELNLSYLSRIGDEGILAICSSCKCLSTLSLDNCRNLTDASLGHLGRLPSLRCIRLKGMFSFTATGLARGLGACEELLKVSLDLKFMEIDPALGAMASGCRKREEAELIFKAATLRALEKFSSLRSLSIYSDQRLELDATLLGIMEANKNLVEITYTNPWSSLYESTVIQLVMKSPKLRKLHLDALSLSEVVLMSIVQCKELEHLALDHYRSSGEGLAQLGLYGLQLRHFSLKSAQGIRDVEIQMLVRGKNLEHLNLQDCSGLTPIGFASIASCSGLQHLDLSFTGVDDISLSEIASGVKNLKSLSLVKCEAISSSRAVGLFSSLESLTVDQCPFVNDESLRTIADRCEFLRNLSLAFTRVTDTGLLWLTKCRYLRTLSVPYCREIQGEGIIGVVEAIELQLVVLSSRFIDSTVVGVLKRCSCFAHFEVDDMALVPFGGDAALMFG